MHNLNSSSNTDRENQKVLGKSTLVDLLSHGLFQNENRTTQYNTIIKIKIKIKLEKKVYIIHLYLIKLTYFDFFCISRLLSP